MTKLRLLLTGLIFLVLTSLTVNAATVDLIANMDCAQANAGNGTCAAGGSGTGLALIQLDDVSNELSWNISWSGLSGTATVHHFHGAALPNQNAGVQVNIGTATNPRIGSTTISNSQKSDLLAGLWYVNLHSTTFGGGEIRGQVNVVPIPAAVWLFASALAGLGFIKRRNTA